MVASEMEGLEIKVLVIFHGIMLDMFITLNIVYYYMNFGVCIDILIVLDIERSRMCAHYMTNTIIDSANASLLPNQCIFYLIVFLVALFFLFFVYGRWLSVLCIV